MEKKISSRSLPSLELQNTIRTNSDSKNTKKEATNSTISNIQSPTLSARKSRKYNNGNQALSEIQKKNSTLHLPFGLNASNPNIKSKSSNHVGLNPGVENGGLNKKQQLEEIRKNRLLKSNIRDIEEMANDGEPEFLVKLAECYKYGVFEYPIDKSKEDYYLNLATCIEKVQGSKNQKKILDKETVDFLFEAAKTGHPGAQFQLSRLCRAGVQDENNKILLEKDGWEENYWLQRAIIKGGHADARRRLGEKYAELINDKKTAKPKKISQEFYAPRKRAIADHVNSMINNDTNNVIDIIQSIVIPNQVVDNSIVRDSLNIINSMEELVPILEMAVWSAENNGLYIEYASDSLGSEAGAYAPIVKGSVPYVRIVPNADLEGDKWKRDIVGTFSHEITHSGVDTKYMNGAKSYDAENFLNKPRKKKELEEIIKEIDANGSNAIGELDIEIFESLNYPFNRYKDRNNAWKREIIVLVPQFLAMYGEAAREIFINNYPKLWNYFLQFRDECKNFLEKNGGRKMDKIATASPPIVPNANDVTPASLASAILNHATIKKFKNTHGWDYHSKIDPAFNALKEALIGINPGIDQLTLDEKRIFVDYFSQAYIAAKSFSRADLIHHNRRQYVFAEDLLDQESLEKFGEKIIDMILSER